MLTRIVLAVAIGLAATSRTLAHRGHGQDGEASGLYHYLTSHGLGVVLLLTVILAALLMISRVHRGRMRPLFWQVTVFTVAHSVTVKELRYRTSAQGASKRSSSRSRTARASRWRPDAA